MSVLKTYLGFRRSQAVTNSIWNILSSIALRGSVFAVNIILAHVLGVELYGKYSFLKNTSQVFEFSLGIAFGISMTKFIAERIQNHNRKELYGIIKSNLSTSIILSLLMVVALEFFARTFLTESMNQKNDLLLLRISFLYLFFSNLSHSFIGILKGLEKFKLFFIISVIVGSVNIISVLFFSAYFQLAGAIIAFTLLSFIQLIILVVVVEKQVPVIKILFSRKIKYNHSIQKSFNTPAILSGLAAPPVLWVLNYRLIKLSNGLEEVAFFNVGFLIFALLVFAPMAISDSLFPSINKLIHNKNEFLRTIKKHLSILSAISIFIALPTIIFPAKILLFFGKDFSSGASILFYFSVASVFSSLLTYLGKVMAALHLMWANLFFNFLWAILVLLLSLINTNKGAEWVALSFIYSYAILFLIQGTYIWQKINKK